MDTAGIQNTERTKIVDAILKVGFNPKEFNEKFVTPQILKISYKNSGLFFKMEMKPDDYGMFKYAFSTFTPNRKSNDQIAKWYHFVDVLANFNKWLVDHVGKYRDAETLPDPWEPFRNSDIQSFSNETFDAKTIAFIEPKIDTTKQRLENVKVSDPLMQEQLDRFAQELFEIKEELKSLRKKSWTRQIIGWAGQLATFASEHVPEETADEIKKIIKDFFDQFDPNQHLLS